MVVQYLTKLPQPWNSKSNVHLTTTSKVESVEGHLSWGLTNRLHEKNKNNIVIISNALVKPSGATKPT